MSKVVSIREKQIDRIVQELKEDDAKNGRPIEIAEALGQLMRDGKVDFVRRDGEWAFYLSTKDY